MAMLGCKEDRLRAILGQVKEIMSYRWLLHRLSIGKYCCSNTKIQYFLFRCLPVLFFRVRNPRLDALIERGRTGQVL